MQIFHGDALNRLRDMPSESVHCCVTSPPYFGLRDYVGIEINAEYIEMAEKRMESINPLFTVNEEKPKTT